MWKQDLWEIFRIRFSWGWSPHGGISVLTKRWEDNSFFSSPCEDTEKVVLCESEGGTRTHHAGPWSQTPAFQTVRNECLLFVPLNPWYSVLVVWTKAVEEIFVGKITSVGPLKQRTGALPMWNKETGGVSVKKGHNSLIQDYTMHIGWGYVPSFLLSLHLCFLSPLGNSYLWYVHMHSHVHALTVIHAHKHTHPQQSLSSINNTLFSPSFTEK